MKIQLKRSNVLEGGAAKKPTPAQMEYGELAVNYNADDPSIFLEDHLGNIVKVGGDLSLYQKIDSIGTAVFVCSPGEINVQSPLADRVEGTLWWNTEEGVLYVWYEDADSSQWVIAVPQTEADIPPGTSVGETPPSDPEEGQLWWNSSDDSGRLYVYYDDGNSQQWVEASPQGEGFSGDYNDLLNRPNIPDGFDLEDGSELNNLIVWRSAGEALTVSEDLGATDSQHPSGSNITYTDITTTATSGSGTGMTVIYDVNGSGKVSGLTVSFPGSNYQPGDTFTVDGRGFGGSVLTTSSDTGNRPGPDGTSGWYPEPGQNYYVSTRVDSTVHSLPTFEAGFIGGRATDRRAALDGSYTFYPPGARNRIFTDYHAESVFRTIGLNNGDSNRMLFRIYRKVNDTTDNLANELSLRDGSTAFNFYETDGSALRSIELTSKGIHCSETTAAGFANDAGEIRIGKSGQVTFYQTGGSDITFNFTNAAPTQIRGNAPLYVRRAAIADKLLRISSETVLELQGDDPTAYQTAYVLDEDGQQIEQQEYIGQTETLLEIIRDLRTRLAALEGA